MNYITVTQLTNAVKSCLTGDSRFKNLYVRGEISSFVKASSGHCYMDLKDEKSLLKAVMFRSRFDGLSFQPEKGMDVIAHGEMTVYAPNGNYQLVVDDLLPAGEGAKALALKQLKERLQREGIFAPEHKLPQPCIPQTIGVVTSGTGAALQDILKVLQRRCPMVTVKVFPTLVQGEKAPEAIANAIDFAGTQGCDLLIVGRGGGSKEDLDCFNAECVARALYSCPVFTISAVGHEIDTTIADLAADMRAATPTEAAEKATLQQSELQARLDQMIAFLEQNMSQRLADKEQRLDDFIRWEQDWMQGRLYQYGQNLQNLRGEIAQYRPDQLLTNKQERLQRTVEDLQAQMANRLNEHRRLTESAAEQAENAMQRILREKQARFRELTGKLYALNPLQILQRGYAAAWHENNTMLTSAADAEPGETIRIKFYDGEITARVEGTKHEQQ